MSRMRGRGAFALVLSLALVAGCKDAVQPQEPNVLEGLGPGIHPVVVVASRGGGSASVELQLRRVQTSATVASYQGELEYDARALKLTGAELPKGVMGAWNETSPGKVRFAGAVLEGLADGPVLVLHFTTSGSIRGDGFRVKLEEVVATEGFTDLSPQVVAREQPLFSASPLK